MVDREKIVWIREPSEEEEIEITANLDRGALDREIEMSEDRNVRDKTTDVKHNIS